MGYFVTITNWEVTHFDWFPCCHLRYRLELASNPGKQWSKAFSYFNLKAPCILYTGCPRRKVPDFGRVFLMLNYTDITQNTYVQS